MKETSSEILWNRDGFKLRMYTGLLNIIDDHGIELFMEYSKIRVPQIVKSGAWQEIN